MPDGTGYTVRSVRIYLPPLTVEQQHARCSWLYREVGSLLFFSLECGRTACRLGWVELNLVPASLPFSFSLQPRGLSAYEPGVGSVGEVSP